MTPKPSESSQPVAGDDDRRDFYRITDEIGVELKHEIAGEGHAINPFVEPHLDALQSELHRIDGEIRSQLALLAEKDRVQASLLKSLNSKVDTLARIIAFEQKPLQPEDWKTVTLSEGGISFDNPGIPLQEGQSIALRLTLPPDLVKAVAIGKVLHGSSESGRVQIVFTEVSEFDRQTIARHVMRWQIRQRKTD